MKMYVTKFALAEGIELRDVEYSTDKTYVYDTGAGWWTSFKPGRDAFLEYEDALKAAEAARIKKLASLRKQIAKLEKLTFSKPEV